MQYTHQNRQRTFWITPSPVMERTITFLSGLNNCVKKLVAWNTNQFICPYCYLRSKKNSNSYPVLYYYRFVPHPGNELKCYKHYQIRIAIVRLKCFAYSAILHGNYKRQIWSRRVTIWPLTNQKSVHQAHCPMYQDAMCHAFVVWTKIQIGCPILNTHSITTFDNVLEISLQNGPFSS